MIAHSSTLSQSYSWQGRLLPLIHVLGLVVMMFSTTMILPWGVALWFQDEALLAYDEAILVTFGLGFIAWSASRRHKRELRIRDGFLLVVLVWTVVPAFATLPLLLSMPELSFTDAYFEAASGLTTTGATVLSGLDRLPASINFWRHELVWLGGMGIIVLFVAVLPLLGVGGRQMYKAETPGPMKEDKLTPRITETAKGLWKVYAGMTVLCALAYWLAGMSSFDAVVHAFSTMGLGGFSTHDASFGHFDSPAIEAVAILFMLLAGLNFSTHFQALRLGSMRPYASDVEARWFLAVVVISVLLVAGYLLYHRVYSDFATALRYAAFNTVSIATTTGYANTDYNLWPVFAPLWMLMLCSFTTCSGSTGGGVKLIRAMILYKLAYRELLQSMHPRAMLVEKLGGRPIPTQVLHSVLVFGFLYLSSLLFFTVVLAASGLDLVSAFSATVATINNTGPGLNQVGPATTYEVLTDFQTWVCSFAMILGRLELFAMLLVFTPVFWRN